MVSIVASLRGPHLFVGTCVSVIIQCTNRARKACSNVGSVASVERPDGSRNVVGSGGRCDKPQAKVPQMRAVMRFGAIHLRQELLIYVPVWLPVCHMVSEAHD